MHITSYKYLYRFTFDDNMAINYCGKKHILASPSEACR